MSFNWLIKLIANVLKPFINLLTSQIKEELENFVKNLYKKAKSTENVYDDFFVEMLANILSIVDLD